MQHRTVASQLTLVGLIAMVVVPAAGGCSGTSSDAEPAGASVVAREPAAPEPGPYAVHEWGLIAASAGSAELRALTSPNGARGAVPFGGGGGGLNGVMQGLQGIGKPVMYAHLDDGTDVLTLAVDIRPAGGARVVEHYPSAVLPPDDSLLRWPEVRVTRGACHGTYPTDVDASCTADDGMCELLELARYETPDSDCVHVGDTQAGLLFYRTGAARAELPLVVERGTGSAVRVRLREGATPVRGWAMRVHRGLDLLNTLVRVERLDAMGAEGLELLPATGEGVVVGNEARDMLQTALVEAGLTASERDAFMLAWSDALFGRITLSDAGGGDSVGSIDALGAGVAPRGGGYAPPNRNRPRVGGASGGGFDTIGSIGMPQESHPLGSVADAVIYILPQASVDGLLPLTLTPPARELHRVFVARVDVSELERVSLRTSPPTVTGALDVDVVRRVVRRRFAALRRCMHPGSDIRTFRLELRVTTTGAVSDATVDAESVSDDERACLLRVARSASFPSAETVSTVSYPFTVSP